ncbi:MAG: ankyrin repeat domain-containing protein [Dokdonella sp.]
MQTKATSVVLIAIGVAVIGASLYAMFVEPQHAAPMGSPGPAAAVASTKTDLTKARATKEEIDQSRLFSAAAAALIDSYTGDRDLLEQAQSKLKQALALDERNVDAYVEMARYQMKVADNLPPNVLGAAELSLRKGLAFDPQHGNSYVLLGYVLTKERRFEPAKQAFDKARELSATSPWLDMNTGELLLQQGDIEGGLRHYEAVVNTPAFPANVRAQAHEVIARQEARAGQLDLARKSYEKALELQPNNAWMMGNYAGLLRVSMLDIKESEQWARRALEKMNYGAGRETLGDTLYLKWAEALIKEKDPAKAEKIYAEAKLYARSPDELLHEIHLYPHGHPIIEALAAKGYSLDHFPGVDSGGGTAPISTVAGNRNLPILKQLLAAGANIDEPGYEGGTALMIAAAQGNLPMTEFLLSKGANPFLLAAEGLDAEGLAQAEGHPEAAGLVAKAKQRSPEKRAAPSSDGLPKIGHTYLAKKSIEARDWNDQFAADEVLVYQGTGGMMNVDRTQNNEFIGLRFSSTTRSITKNWALKKSTPGEWSNYFEEATEAKP